MFWTCLKGLSREQSSTGTTEKYKHVFCENGELRTNSLGFHRLQALTIRTSPHCTDNMYERNSGCNSKVHFFLFEQLDLVIVL